MDDIYGPLKKSFATVLFFVVPAVIIAGLGVWLAAEDAGSVSAAFSTPTALICCGLGMALVIWGAVFMSQPIVTLTAQAVVWPGGRVMEWSNIKSVEAGQSATKVASGSGSNRTVVHEVMRLTEANGDVTKITTTWAAIGPQAANQRIEAAFRHSK